MKNKNLHYLTVTMALVLHHFVTNGQHLYLQPETVPQGVEVVYAASNTLYSPPTVVFIVESGGRADLKAGNRIELHPGFQVQNGGMLSAVIEEGKLVEANDKQALTVYPNPTDGIINVVSPTPVDHARLMDIYGFDVLMERKLAGESDFIMDLSSIKSGIYLLEITSGKTKEQVRIERR